MDNFFNTVAFSQELTPETFTNEVGHILSQPNSNGCMPPATQEKVVLTICNGAFCVDGAELCSFIFSVDHKETIIRTSYSEQTIVLLVRAICPNGNGSEEITLGDPEYFTLPTKAKDDMKLVSLNLGLEYMIYNMPHFKKIFQRMILHANMVNVRMITNTGWQGSDGYAFSNGLISTRDCSAYQIRVDDVIKSHSLKISPDSIVSKEQELKAAMLIINHWFNATKSPVCIFLYLLLILSFLTTALRKQYANHSPRFLTMIYAEPLSGKTRMCEILLGFMNYIPKVDISSGTTEWGIMEEARKCKDCVFLVDDFKIPPQDRKRVEALLETLTRVAGNNSEKKNAKGTFSVDSQILITAETIPNLSESSINRMLIWKLRKEDFDREEENKIGDNPELYATHILMLLRWIVSSDITLLCEKMNDSFLAERAKISKDGSYCDRRIDAYAWLLAAYNVLFCGYMSGIDLIYPESSRNEYQRLYNYAITDLREQLREQLAKDPVYHFCKNIVSQRDKLIAASPLSTLDDKSLGFWKRDYYLLLTDAVDKVIDSRYPIDEDLLLTRLENEEILVPDPNRSRVSRHQHNGESKKVYKLSEHNVQRYVDHIDQEIYKMKENDHD